MTKFKTMSAIASLGLLMGAAAAPVAASAYAQQPQQPPAMNQQQMEPVSDAEIVGYVNAAEAVGEIIEEVQPQLEQAQSEEQVNQLQMSAQEEMVQVVADNGLTPQRYNQIAAAARTNPELGERISQIAAEHGSATPR